MRRRYAAITAGYHLSKRHWNTANQRSASQVIAHR